MWVWVSVASAAGYGDPEAGSPSPDEREMLTWVNAARVDPEAFEGNYEAGGCSLADFSDDERTPKPPLRWNADLGEAARFHSDDMDANDWFDHRSSDGTPFGTRVARFYANSTIGENIFFGGGTMEQVVLSGWMCSSAGHRGAIMSGGFDEAGTGVAGDYATLDFGLGGLGPRAVGVGAHLAAGPTMALQADVHTDGAPDAAEVVVDGVAVALTLTAGDAGNGFYRGAVDVSGGCQTYWFRVLSAGVETRFPETGSYGWGDCAWDDAGAQWVDEQTPREGSASDDGDGDAPGCRCASSSGLQVGNMATAVGLLTLGLRHRRRGPGHGLSRLS